MDGFSQPVLQETPENYGVQRDVLPFEAEPVGGRFRLEMMPGKF